MNAGVVSMRYAKALLTYAMECGAEDAVYDSMKRLLRAVEVLKELPILLRAPMLSCDDRVEMICKVIGKSSVLERFARLVVKEQREELLPQIAYCYARLYCKEKSLLPVKFVTAQPLDDKMKSSIETRIATSLGKRVEMQNIVDESIIGGYVYEADFRRLDASVSGQLREIRKVLVKQNKKLV